MEHPPLALQMYTLRDLTAQDFLGTLRKVADIGYTGVELAGAGGLGASELRAALSDLGLQAAGSHVSLDRLENDLDAALDYHAELGCRFVVCPWIGEDRRRSAGDYRVVADSLNKAGQPAKERGLQLCYHNHAFEFDRFDGQTGLDLLFSATDPGLVHAELDTYWVQYGGDNPVDWLRRLAGRAPLIHLKDMAAGESRTFAEVGEGIMDWRAILPACEAAGAQWLIVEQDVCQRPPLEAIEVSFKNLKALGYGG